MGIIINSRKMKSTAILLVLTHLYTNILVEAYQGSFETNGGANARWSYSHDSNSYKERSERQRRRFGGHQSRFDESQSMMERIKRQAISKKESTLHEVPVINLINSLQLGKPTLLGAMQGDQKLAEALMLLPSPSTNIEHPRDPRRPSAGGSDDVKPRTGAEDSRPVMLENEKADVVLAVINPEDLSVPTMVMDALAVETAVPTSGWVFQPKSCEPVDSSSFGRSMKVPEDAQEFNLPNPGKNMIPLKKGMVLDSAKPLVIAMKTELGGVDCPILMRVENVKSYIGQSLSDLTSQGADSIAATLLEGQLKNGRAMTMEIMPAVKSHNPVPVVLFIAGTVDTIKLDEIKVVEDAASGATTLLIPDLTKNTNTREPEQVNVPMGRW